MQISFLKDLVSQRNPASSYSFLSYLHDRDRLTDFINLKTFFPSRQEFHDYLCWAAARVSVPVDYGARAVHVEWTDGAFSVTTEMAGGARETVRAKTIVSGMGITPHLPEGVTAGPRVFHNHCLLENLDWIPSHDNGRLVVVGSGQSAAEVAAHLHDVYPDSEIHVSFRRFGFTPSDDTPYANRIFDPTAVDEFYHAPESTKRRLLDYHWLTNYSAVDADLIEDLYKREYSETVSGRRRLIVHRMTEVLDVTETDDRVSVTLRNMGSREQTRLDADAVVFATGFRPGDFRSLLGDGIATEGAFNGSRPEVERDYGLRLPELPGRVFLNGGVEDSHGLTSSLLSNIAIRAQDILEAVSRRVLRVGV